MKRGHLQTMRIAFGQICAGEREWTALGNFMNEWYEYAKDRRDLLVIDPLATYDEQSPYQHQWAVFCAASVEWFCHKYHVPCPDWVHDSKYTLCKPWYFGQHESVKESLLRTTPEEFAHRNVYCGDDIYANKWEWVEQQRERLRQAGAPKEVLDKYWISQPFSKEELEWYRTEWLALLRAERAKKIIRQRLRQRRKALAAQ